MLITKSKIYIKQKLIQKIMKQNQKKNYEAKNSLKNIYKSKIIKNDFWFSWSRLSEIESDCDCLSDVDVFDAGNVDFVGVEHSVKRGAVHHVLSIEQSRNVIVT